MQDYIIAFPQQLAQALRRIPAGPLIIFGAGSHTARLLSYLERILISEVLSVDCNIIHLVGKRLVRWTALSHDRIQMTPKVALLVSSFRSHEAIATHLLMLAPNPFVLLYH